jgi:hypothetical protein
MVGVVDMRLKGYRSVGALVAYQLFYARPNLATDEIPGKERPLAMGNARMTVRMRDSLTTEDSWSKQSCVSLAAWDFPGI